MSRTRYKKARTMLPVAGALVLLSSLSLPLSVNANHDTFHIKTANYFLKAGADLLPPDYPRLAAFDVLILPMEAQVYNRDFFLYARAHHPAIRILAYVPSRSINVLDLEDFAQIRKRLKNGIREEWYLTSSAGTVVSAWPGTIPINVTSGWNMYLPQFVQESILSTGVWDGILYDEVQDSMAYLNSGDIDLDRNGYAENQIEMDSLWQDGVRELLRNSRLIFGDSTLIITNGSSLREYSPYVNGRMFENFPAPEEGVLWPKIMKQYLSLPSQVRLPSLFVINANTRNGGAQNNYRRVRYSLASTLLGDNGYFSFDFGDQNHGQIWHYDEYGAALGSPKGGPVKTNEQREDAQASNGIWRRDYEQGLVLLNASDEHTTVDLLGEYEHLHGAQDPSVNSGIITDTISLASRDGRILLRPLELLTDAAFRNGTFARVLSATGIQKRTGFFSYIPHSKGGSAIIKSTLPDGSVLTVSARQGHVTFRRVGQPDRLFAPFGAAWKDELNIAVGDTNSDGILDVVISPERTRATPLRTKNPPVKIFDSNTGTELASFFPYGKKFSGSIRVATRLDHKSNSTIVTGVGSGFPPEVKVFNGVGKPLQPGFLAYDRHFRGGVDVAVADTDGDMLPEIITAPGYGARPIIRRYTMQGKPLGKEFLGLDESNTSGVRITAADLDHDGIDEIIPMTMRVFTLSAVQ